MRPLFSIFLLLILTSSAWAASIKLTLAPAQIHLGESAELYLTIDGTPAEIAPYRNNPPDFSKSLPDIQVKFSGRSFVPQLTHAYNLTPSKLGSTTLAPKPMTLGGGKRVSIAPVTLKVVPRPAADKLNNEFGVPRDTPIFVRVIPAETNLVPNQVVQVDVLVYNLVISATPESISYGEDFKCLEFSKIARSRLTIIGDKRYSVSTYRTQVIPQRKGTFSLSPEVSGRIKRPVRNSFLNQITRATFPLAPSPTVTVSPLPTNDRPASFQAAVGNYQLDCTVNAPDDLRVGDPINLTMTVQGNGLIQRVAPPIIAIDPDAPGFRIYEPRRVHENVANNGASGTRTWEQVIEATSTNITEIPPVRFAFYNPKLGRYLEREKGPFPITVSSDIADRSAIQRPVAGSPPGRAGRIVNQDLLFLKPLPPRWRATNTKPWYLTVPFLASSLIPPALLLGTFLFTRRRNTLQSDVAKARRLQAPKAAKAGIAAAETALYPGDRPAFYEGIARALTDYFGNRLNLPPGAVSADRVAAAFPSHADSARELFAACESQRFGGGTNIADDDPGAHLDQLKALLRDCEKEKIETAASA